MGSMTHGPLPGPRTLGRRRAEHIIMSGGRVNSLSSLEYELLRDPIWQDILACNQVWIDETDRILNEALTHAAS